jgi:hypothetical protein
MILDGCGGTTLMRALRTERDSDSLRHLSQTNIVQLEEYQSQRTYVG